MGISSLMGYQDGGGVEDETLQQSLDDPSVQALLAKMLANQGGGDDTQAQFRQYTQMLDTIAPPRPRATGYDLASSLGAGLLAQQGEKFSSLGRGIGLGFQDFNKLQKEIDAENRKNKQTRDMTAFGLVTKKKNSPAAKQGALWKNGPDEFFRELLIGDQLIYKGEGQVMDEAEFNTAYPEARPTVASESARYKMDINKFFEYEKQMTEQENSINALEKYISTFDDSKQGFERMGVGVQNFFNTLLSTDGISEAELAQGLQEGKFQALIGRFREEVVGPGVMTEFDAARIIAALGGEPGALQNPYRVRAILKDVFEQKVGLYEKALRKYNVGAGSGEFAGYEEKAQKTWNMSMFDSPLNVPVGAVLDEEIKNAAGKVVAIIYMDTDGKKKRRALNGTITEVKENISTTKPKVPLP